MWYEKISFTYNSSNTNASYNIRIWFTDKIASDNWWKINEAYKANTDQRNASIEVLKKIFDKDTAVVLGSSELSATDQVGFPSYLFGNRKSEMKMVLMGSGYKQCLHQATAVGAYSDILPKKKVVLILSPQWFTKNGLDPDAYASRFSERLYLEMMDNKNISEKLKNALLKG